MALDDMSYGLPLGELYCSCPARENVCVPGLPAKSFVCVASYRSVDSRRRASQAKVTRSVINPSILEEIRCTDTLYRRNENKRGFLFLDHASPTPVLPRIVCEQPV